MSASLMVLIPPVLLVLVAAVCFVGCGLVYNYGGYTGQSNYRMRITGDPHIVACWPLDDQMDIPADPSGTPAVDIVTTPAQFNGTYIGAPGTIKLGQPGIATGDVPVGASVGSFCTLFKGGLVSVPFKDALNPANFTLEAWVQPNWSSADPQGQRAVLVSAILSAGAGYALVASDMNFWQIQIGVGGGAFHALTATDPIDFAAAAHYLAATYDGTKLTLYVGTVGMGGAANTFKTYENPQPTFVQETSMTATSLFIAMGAPDMGGMHPFNGLIQDVAVYSAALQALTINEHFVFGGG